MKTPVLFRWKDADGNERQGEGTSRDVSESGAFVVATVSPPLNADIELVISFVALRNALTTEPVKLDGRVLRVEPNAAGKGSGGFAVLTQEVVFGGQDESTGGIKSA